MKKSIAVMVAAATLTMSASAGVVDSGFTLNSFNYAFSMNDNKCEEMPSFFAEDMYTRYKNGDGDFMKYGVMNVVGTNNNYFLFYEDKSECEFLQNGNKVETIKVFVEYSTGIAHFCKIKPTTGEAIDVANSAIAYARKNLGKVTQGDIIKYAIKENGLKCN